MREIMESKNKSTKYTDLQLAQMSKKFKIISEVSRLKILRTLFTGEKCVTDIINATGLLQANVSKQLRLLEDASIVTCRPHGLMRYYVISDPSIQSICNLMCEYIN